MSREAAAGLRLEPAEFEPDAPGQPAVEELETLDEAEADP